MKSLIIQFMNRLEDAGKNHWYVIEHKWSMYGSS